VEQQEELREVLNTLMEAAVVLEEVVGLLQHQVLEHLDKVMLAEMVQI